MDDGTKREIAAIVNQAMAAQFADFREFVEGAVAIAVTSAIDGLAILADARDAEKLRALAEEQRAKAKIGF